jgi:CBS domain-containing protein/predicted DNA-binding WGR domain protein
MQISHALCFGATVHRATVRRTRLRARPPACASCCEEPEHSWDAVSDIMRTQLVSLREDTPLHLAALRMLASGVHAAPVVSADGGLVGVLSSTDLLSLAAPEPAAQPDLARLQYRNGELRDSAPLSLQHSVAADAMSAPVTTIASNLPVAEASRVMLAKGYHVLPVTCAELPSKVVGIVTRGDVLRAVVNRAAASWAREGVPPELVAEAPEMVATASRQPAALRHQRLELEDEKSHKFYEQTITYEPGRGYLYGARWGRKGSKGMARAGWPGTKDWFSSYGDASAVLKKTEAQKRSKGYWVASDDTLPVAVLEAAQLAAQRSQAR